MNRHYVNWTSRQRALLALTLVIFALALLVTSASAAGGSTPAVVSYVSAARAGDGWHCSVQVRTGRFPFYNYAYAADLRGDACQNLYAWQRVNVTVARGKITRLSK